MTEPAQTTLEIPDRERHGGKGAISRCIIIHPYTEQYRRIRATQLLPPSPIQPEVDFDNSAASGTSFYACTEFDVDYSRDATQHNTKQKIS